MAETKLNSAVAAQHLPEMDTGTIHVNGQALLGERKVSDGDKPTPGVDGELLLRSESLSYQELQTAVFQR